MSLCQANDPARTLRTASSSLLDAIFTNGYGESAYATQTHGAFTTLLRVNPSTGALYPVGNITWPARKAGEASVTAFDFEAWDEEDKLRRLTPSAHTRPWTQSGGGAFSSTVYTRFVCVPETSHIEHATISTTTRGLLFKRQKIDCELQLLPSGGLNDDIDVILAALLLVASPSSWKKRQSVLSIEELESCLNVTHLRSEDKWLGADTDDDFTM